MAQKKRPAARTSNAPSRKPATPARKSKAPVRKAAGAVPAISPCLWFDGQAEEAANYYVSIFPKGRIKAVTRTPGVGREIHGRAEGSVLCVEFELNGLTFLALNGGPQFKFNQAISLMVPCGTQEEIDYYWEKLRAGGDPGAEACGWLKDRYGLSWQVYWRGMLPMWKDPKAKSTQRAFAAMMEMTKIDIAALKRAYKG